MSTRFGKDPTLEHDLKSTNWIIEKMKLSESYSQHLYAALCNNTFTKREVWQLIKGATWSCSWRTAGGIVANLRGEGDYLDWYCSGIGEQPAETQNYVSESTVTDEIENDLFTIGWIINKDNE